MFASTAAAGSTGLSLGHTLFEQVNPNPQSNLLPPALALMCCSMVLEGANSLFISTSSLQLAPSPNMQQLLLLTPRTICQCTAYQPFAVHRATSTRAICLCADGHRSPAIGGSGCGTAGSDYVWLYAVSTASVQGL